MTTKDLTPKIHAQLVAKAEINYNKAGVYTESAFNKCFGEVVKQAGYDIEAYNKHAKEYFCCGDEDFDY